MRDTSTLGPALQNDNTEDWCIVRSWLHNGREAKF